MKRLSLKIFCAAALLITITGCSMKKITTSAVGKIVTDGATVLESEQDLDLARSSTPTLIVTLDVLAKGNPTDRRMLTLLARSYGQYAFGFLEEDILKYKDADAGAYEKALARANLFYRRGKEYGLASLWPKKALDKVLGLPQDAFEKELNKFGKGRVPSLFWTAFSWGNWINLNRDDIEAVADVPRVEAMIKRVLKLDPNYYYGSAHSFLGSLAASRPAMLGGNQKLARDEFEAAIGVNEKYLMTKVLFAQYYGVQFQDRSLFEKLLNEVKSSDVRVFPEQRLANELAVRRAILLLEREKKFF